MIDFEKLKEKGIEKDDLRLVAGKTIWKDFEINDTDFYKVDDEDIMQNNQTNIYLTIKNSLGDEDSDSIAELEATLYEAPIVFSPKDENGDYREIPTMHEIFDMHSAELGGLIADLVKDDDNLDEYNQDLVPKKLHLLNHELNMLYINKINVKEEYQNCGLGTYLLENIEKIMYEKLQEKFHFATICPACYSKRKEDLKKLYRKCGFKTYRKGEFMVKKNTWYKP